MTRTRLNRMAAVLPLMFSAAAFVLVLANMLAGVAPQPDENTSAHIWQLLMVAQVPLILLFVVTADWRSRRSPLLLALQFGAIAIACFPVWLAGY